MVVALHIHHTLYDAVGLLRIIDILAAFCNGQYASTMALDADLSRFVAYQHINSPADARKRFGESYLRMTRGYPFRPRIHHLAALSLTIVRD